MERLESDNTYQKFAPHVHISYVATVNVSQARGIGVSRKMCVCGMIYSQVFLYGGHDSFICTGEEVERLESDNTYNKVVSHVQISHVATVHVCVSQDSFTCLYVGHDSFICTGEEVERLESDNTQLRFAECHREVILYM